MYSGPQRKSLRLKSYDYDQDGYYFVTICTKDREHFLGDIKEGIMSLSEMGEIVKNEIESDVRDNIMIDSYIIMPNHIHAIIIIQNPVGCDRIAPGMNNDPKTNNKTQSPVGCDRIAPGMNNDSETNNDTQNLVGCDRIAPKINTTPNTDYASPDTGTMQSFPTLSRVIRGLKGRITSQIQQNCETGYLFGWQKSYYDVIIRNEEQLFKTRQYISDNPRNWENDSNNIESHT